VAGVAHCAVFAGVVKPTELEQTRTETVLVVAPFKPMLAIAKAETSAALGSAACAGEDGPCAEYATALLAAESSAVATKKKYPKSIA